MTANIPSENKRYRPIAKSIEIPLDIQSVFDGSVPFNSLVLKPLSAAFDEEFEMLMFVNKSFMKCVSVIFTNTGVHASEKGWNVRHFSEDCPGMWVLVSAPNNFSEIEQAIRVTDGTNILIPEVHLAELTGVFGDLRESGSSILPHSKTWSKCLPFARFTYNTALAIPQTAYEVLSPQLTEKLPTGTLVAIIE